jgi:hypothetical protein
MGKGAGHSGNSESQTDMLNGAVMPGIQDVGYKKLLVFRVYFSIQKAGPHVGYKTGMIALPKGCINNSHRFRGVGKKFNAQGGFGHGSNQNGDSDLHFILAYSGVYKLWP